MTGAILKHNEQEVQYLLRRTGVYLSSQSDICLLIQVIIMSDDYCHLVSYG